MLEYFAATHLFTTGLVSQLDTLDFDEDTWIRVSSKWDDVIISYCGLLAEREEALIEIALRDPELAAMCIQSGITATDYVHDLINSQFGIEIDQASFKEYDDFPDLLENLSFQLNNYIVVDDIRSFNGLYYFSHDPEAIEIALDALTVWPDTTRETAATTLEIIGDKTAIPSLVVALS